MERLRYMEAIGGRMLRAVLAIALVAYLFVPASVSFAEAGDGSGATGKTEQVPEAVQSEKGDASKDGAAESGQPKSGEGASAVQASVDLTALWESDHPRIEAAGEYVLAGDVHAGQPLVVALPAGAIAKVDLAGFSAVVEAEEGDKAPTCAIDLSANAGEIVFVDSAYDEDADAMASITLKTADSTADTAVVRSVQNASTLDSEPSASFEHVRLASDASVKSLDSFGASHTVVKTGAEPGEDKRRARDAAARIAFKGCAFEVNVDERLTVENRAEAISRGMTRGAESVIDAEVAGITLAGPTSAAMKAGSRDAAPTTPALLSRFAATYALAPDFEVASEGQALVFGYPSEAKADASDVGEAVVALPEARSTISAKAAGSIAAAEGYDLKLDAAPDGKPGYAGVSLVAKKAEAPSGDSPAAPVPEAGAPADEPSAVEQATAAAPHIYADYLAAHADEAVYVEEIATQAQDVDLNSSWAALDGGLASTYTITSAGTYYLSDDLSASNGIAIDAPGKDVRIELRGHALTLNGTGSAAQKTMVSIAAAKSVTFDGSAASGLSEIKSAGNADVWGISSNASGCAVRANDLAVTLSSSTNAQRNLATHAVRVASGSLELSRCTLNMLMGNQTLNSASLLQSASEPPSAVFAASGASSVVLEDCTVVGEGSQGVSCSLDDTTSLGNAYALYSQAASTKVAGGTYRALSALGNATCLHGAHLEIASSASADAVSLEADAGQLASGILSTAQASVSVEAPLSFTVASGYEGRADSEAALRSTVEGGFVFGECASSASARYPVLLMTATGDLASANSAGSVIGTFSASLDDAGVSAVLAALGNALGSGCSVGRDLLGRACFTFDNASPANAVASVTHAGASAYYPTLGSALAALGGGETLTLLCDVDAMNVAVADGAVIDLNGHEVGFLEYSAQGAGGALTVKNGSIAGTGAVNGSRASVYHHAGSALVLDDLEITATGSDAVVYGVYGAAGAGALTMSDTAVYVCASRTSAGAGAYGIGMANGGPALTLEHDDIRVSTASAGVPVYGVSCANGLAMSQGAIVARGATGTTGAIFAGGEVSVEGADLDVRTTGTSSGSYGFGIWGRTANPQATSVSVRSCSISVQSSADLRGSTYACLLAATSDASSSPIAWTLSGENVLASSSGLTFGLGMGNITLGDDFELGSGSDGKLVVAQSRIEGNAGFVIEGSPSSARLAQLAALFAARDGSYYSGWSLGADQEASRLVWAVPGAPSEGAVTLVRGGSAQSGHACVTDALEAAQAGDTLRLNCDVAESGTYAVAQSDLTLDLNGHDLVLNTGGMKASSSGGYDGIAFTGDGTLLVKGGSLDIRMGAPSEIARVAQVPYRGVSVTGGGRLSIASDATLNVSYVGSTASAASQRSVTLSGIVVTDGAVALDGALSVTGSASDGGYGSMQTHGILSQPDEGRTADVAVGEKAKVSVDSAAAPITAKNAYYVESTYNATTNDGPTGVREIAIDPDADPVLYQDVIDIFQQRATYDDPNDSNDRNGLSTGVYYLLDAALSREGAWYDGLRIWAYSDQVAVADVGKLDVVVPAHVFISSPYDTLPQAYGIASDAQAQGTSQVTVQGGVAVACSHGEASALMAAGEASWRCEGAELAAFADDTVHPIAQGSFDLRDFVDFSPAQSAAIAYSGTKASNVVKFESPKARDVVVDEGASFTFAGALALASSALDAAHVEASSFDVESSFALSATPLGNGMTGTLACDVASPAGENAEGTTFARGATSAQAALFADAYREMQPVAAADGVAWSAASNSVVAFQVGDAVVARYANPSTIDLAEPTAAAKRADDERQTYEIAGWSLVPDENATSGYESADATITPAGSATYYAVYETGLASVPVRFANVFDLSGNLQPDVAFTAEYGSSVGEAARAAGASIPAPADYADASTGLEYRFAGWFPYSASISSGALLYDPVQVEDLDITLSVSGVSATGLVLRAVYVAVEPGCHLVTFKVDGYTSYCVVGDGARPVYTAANGTNTSYVSPAKQVSEAGKTFTFNCWFVDADGDGSRSEGEPSYDSVLPKAYGDVSYTADWTWVWSDVTLTFYTKYYDEATDSLVLNGMRIINTTYETQTQAAADSVARIGSSFGYGGKVYTLDGWSIRKSDTQAVYDAGRPLPSVTNDDRFLAANYSKSFYGVYSVADHKLNVAFFDSDGARELGRAEGLVAIRTSVDAAFKATGAAEPQASKGSQVFLGWALEPGADKAMSSSATMLESLVTYEDSSLNLYAVYGSNPTHTVRLRDAQGDQVLYRVSVAQGATVSSALRKAGVDVEMTAPVGKYFAGWRTAAGQFFSLDAPVSGSADVYASYRSIKVDTAKAEGVTAAVSLSKELNSTLGIGDELNEVRLTVEQRSSADSPLRSQMAADGYTLLKGYTVKLAATYASGESVVQEGDIGSVQLKIPVESKYADAKVHVYWLGLEKGSEKVMRSGEKQLEDGERISVNIGNTEVGDEDEGGNVAVIYREGGAGTGGLVDGATGGLSETGTSSLSSGLSSSGLSSSLSGASSGLAASSATGPAAGAAALSASGDTTGADGGASPDALAAGEEGSMTGNWDGDAIVLVALAAVALAALLYGIWRLAVVRPRREEAQAEMPVMLDQYAKGLRF